MTQNRFQPEQTPYLAVDIIIRYRDGIVLIERKNFPHGLALPGGFAKYGKRLEQSAIEEAKEETNLDVILASPEHPLCIYSHPLRDPRAHIASAVYSGTGYGELKAGDDAKEAGCYSLKQVIEDILGKNKFAFPDHEKMVNEYFRSKWYIYDAPEDPYDQS